MIIIVVAKTKTCPPQYVTERGSQWRLCMLTSELTVQMLKMYCKEGTSIGVSRKHRPQTADLENADLGNTDLENTDLENTDLAI